MFCESSHWFYQWARKDDVSLVRYPITLFTEIWPSLESVVVTAREDLGSAATRLLDLQDTLPDRFGLRTFARKRINIRSDKPLHALAPEQRKIARIQHGVPVVPMHLTALQRKYIARKRLARMKGKPGRYLLLKYRRGGFTTLEQSASYKVWCTEARSQVVTLAHSMASTKRIFRMVNLMHEYDPRSPMLASESKSQLESAENGALFFIGTAGSTGFGRGDTLQRVHGSEVSKWCHQDEERVADLVAGLTEAASQGEVVLETTPDGIEYFAKQYKDAKAGLNDWTPLFLAWFDDPLNRAAPGDYDPEEIRETLTDREKFLIDLHGLDMAQIAFRRAKVRELKKLFPQEYPERLEESFLASAKGYFDAELMNEIARTADPPVSVGDLNLPGLTIWKQPVMGDRYVIGADCAEGLADGDYSCAVVIHPKTMSVVARFHARIGPREYARALKKIAGLYGNAMIGPEREATCGGEVITHLCSTYGYSNVYAFAELSKAGKRQKRLGWSTNASTRSRILEDLRDALESGELTTNDTLFAAEAKVFEDDGTGHFEARSGCHDDVVMATAIAWRMRNEPPRGAEIYV